MVSRTAVSKDLDKPYPRVGKPRGRETGSWLSSQFREFIVKQDIQLPQQNMIISVYPALMK